MNSVNHNKLLKPIPCVQISHVTKRFGEDLVLKEVNLDLNYGQVYGIVGNNGSGKTVLMKCICGFLPATTGTIHVSGKQIGKDTDFPESLGVIIETPGFLTQYTGMKNLEILANMQRLISKADIRLILRKVGLDPDMKKPVQKGDPLCVRTAFICTCFVMVPIWSETLFYFTVFCFFCGVFQSRLQALRLQEEASDKFRSGYHLRSSVICHHRSRRNDLRNHRYFHHRKKG